MLSPRQGERQADNTVVGAEGRFWKAPQRLWQNDTTRADIQDRVFMSPVKPLSPHLPQGFDTTLIPAASPKTSHKHQSAHKGGSSKDVPSVLETLKETDTSQPKL